MSALRSPFASRAMRSPRLANLTAHDLFFRDACAAGAAVAGLGLLRRLVNPGWGGLLRFWPVPVPALAPFVAGIVVVVAVGIVKLPLQ